MKKFTFPLLIAILTTLMVSAQSYTLTSDDVIVTNGVIESCSYDFAIKDIIIPEKLDGQNVTAIGNNSYYLFKSKGITSVQLPSTLERIGSEAFFLNNLTSITIPKSVTTINDWAFTSNKLTSVIFESNSNIGGIGKYAFYGNNTPELSQISFPTHANPDFVNYTDANGNLYYPGDAISNFETSYFIDIPYILTNEDVIVANGIIESCSYNFSLKVIVIPEILDEQIITGIADKNSDLDGVFAFKVIAKVTLPSTIENIGDFAFSRNTLTNVIIPDGVTSVGCYTFFDNSLLSVTIPNSLTTIKCHAFVGNNLTNIIWETNSNIESISEFAFAGNYWLSSVTLPTHANPGFVEYKDGNGNTYNPGDNISDFLTSYEAVIELTPLQLDSLALVALYNATNGPNWTNNTNWLTEPINAWQGISVENGRVVAIELSNNGLSGNIPSKINYLTNLQRLFLDNNKLTGSIPYGIGMLTNLIVLSLSQNQLHGTIPIEIGNLANLKNLNLDFNKLTGNIPSEIGNLRNLYSLFLSNNLLSGNVPIELGNLTILEILSLSNNKLSGILPVEISSLNLLRFLWLFSNELQGSVPLEFNEMTNLQSFDLSNNHVNSLPDLSMLSNLRSLLCHNNKLIFPDIEPNIGIPIFWYSPQDSIGQRKDTTILAGQNFSYHLQTGGEFNQYQWFKDGTLLTNQTSPLLEISSVKPADAGNYYCEVTNTMATDLTLTSRIIRLQVDEKRASKSLIAGFTVDNTQGTVPLLVHFQDLSTVDTTVINLFSPLSGVNIYYIKAVSDLGTKEWNFSSESFSALGIIENTISIDGLKLFAYPDKRMEVDANFKSLDSMFFTYRLKLGGSGSFDENGLPLGRVVSFKVLGNTQVTVVCMSSSSAEDRILKVTADNQYSQIAQIPALGGVISESVANYKPEITSWHWDFGDGNFSTVQNPIHTYYPAGNFDVELIVSNSIFADTLLKFSYIFAENSSACPQHFHTVWEGTFGYDHMNLNILSAQLDGFDLQPGDEIGIFDGDICVGYGKVSQTIGMQNILSVVVSRDDGTGNGFTQGNNITYKFWDCSASSEYLVQHVQYYNNQLNPVSPPAFDAGATAFVELAATSEVCQTLDFSSGWNLFSVPVYTEPTDMLELFQPLITNTSLVKIQDETGKSLENWGIFGGWQNNIGDIVPTEGYKIKVDVAQTLEVCGTPVEYPFAVPLYSGWNITGYPQTLAINAMDIVQQLIDRGALIKVQDEKGNSIENWGIFGGWQNNIGNFVPGQGYKIKVNAEETLTFEEAFRKSAVIFPETVAATRFKPAFEGNGVDHMNINLTGLPLRVFSPGDELAVFDGELCVGATTLMPHHLARQAVSIAVSAADGLGMPGFSEGNVFTLKLWSSAQNREYVLEPEVITGTTTFLKHESTLLSLEKYSTTGLDWDLFAGTTEIKCYPNPFSEEITFEINLAEDAEVQVEIYNQMGQRVKSLATKRILTMGTHLLTWNGKNSTNNLVSPGIYHLKIEIDNLLIHKKIVLSK